MLLSIAGYIDLRFADETGFSLTPNIPYGWIREKEQGGIPCEKGGNLNVFGLLNLKGELTSYPTSENINSEKIIAFLDDYVDSIKQMTVVVVDNAPWHTSKAIENKIKEWEEKSLYLFYLPVYSPHLNLIETLWRKMKYEWLKPEDYLSKETLHEAVLNMLNNYDKSEFSIQFSINCV